MLTTRSVGEILTEILYLSLQEVTRSR